MAAPIHPVLVAADPQWAISAAGLLRRIGELLGTVAVRLDHIGSTAIPGMVAKPVLDLQASVTDLDAAAAVLDGALIGEGWTRSRYETDHVPAGCDDDAELWVKRLWMHRDQPDHGTNLHVRLAGHPNARLALLFRDWFVAHPAAVPGYGRFKTALAEAVDDLGVYTDVKDPVVDVIVAGAEEWAAATGWSDSAG